MTSFPTDTQGDMLWPEPPLLDGIEEIRQNVRRALKVLKGEWFANKAMGVPYVSVRNPDLTSFLLRDMKTAILSVVGVLQAIPQSQDLNHETRIFTVAFMVITNLGNFTINTGA